MSSGQITEGIARSKTISGRTNVIHTNKYTLIDDCYNAAPQSVESGIDLLVKSDAKRTVCVLGDMGELGSDAPRMHRMVGEHAAKCKVGLLVAIGELSYNTYEGAQRLGGNAVYFKTKEEFLEKKGELLCEGDAILIKASHAMKFDNIVENLAEYFK